MLKKELLTVLQPDQSVKCVVFTFIIVFLLQTIFMRTITVQHSRNKDLTAGENNKNLIRELKIIIMFNVKTL